MIFILFGVFANLLSASDLGEYGTFVLYDIFSVLLTIAGAAHILLLTAAVYHDSAAKKSGAKNIWCILTFAGGIPIALLYLLFTHKAGKVADKKKNAVRALVSVSLSVFYVICGAVLLRFPAYYAENHFMNSIVYYENAQGQQVIYDKMGNAYSPQTSENLKYYDRQGNAYTVVTHCDIFSSVPEIDGFVNTETDEQYEIFGGYVCYS